MTWTTDIETYPEFQRLMKRNPESVRLDSVSHDRRIALTLATLLEERDSFYVEGPRSEWRARVFLDRATGQRPHSHPVRCRPRRLDNPIKIRSEIGDLPWDS